MNIVISRFELYPAEMPVGYVVGFSVTANNNRSFYRDVVINFVENESRTDEEIVAEALEILRPSIEAEVARLNALSSLLGTNITLSTPSTPTGEEEIVE